jgi:hypothetical protein
MKASMRIGLLCMLLTGCYTYRPLPSVDGAMAPAGTQVEVRLTTAGAAGLANQVGPDVLYLDGFLVSADSNALTVKMARSETARRVSAEWKGEQITIPREDIAGVSQRKFSVGATALLGGIAGGGLVAAYALLGGTGGASGLVAPPNQGPQ